MKRLLKISFDSLVFSLIPIIQWFVLGLFVDSNLINVFSLTYPLQFIYSLLKSAFGISPNIYALKEKNKNAVMSGIFFGIIFTIIIFGFFLINVDNFINFMNMDTTIYHNFCSYSIIQLGIHSVFSILIEKLYYEEKNTSANVHTILYNSLNLVLIIILSLISKNQLFIITETLIGLLTYVLIMFVIHFDKFKLDLSVFKSIKYDLVDFCDSILFFLIFLFGLSNAATFGVKYLAAINFVALITDCQWDSFGSISEAAKIDLARNKFNYKESRKNAYTLLFLLLSSTLFMLLIMFRFYDLNIYLVLIYLSVEVINFLIYPIYKLKTCYLTLEYSSIKMTFNKFIASGIRVIASFLSTPFCTVLGQLISAFYQLISTNIIIRKEKRKCLKI